jgi:hypothetical protein
MSRWQSFRVRVGGVGAALILATLGTVASGALGSPPAGASPTTVVYDSTVAPLPGNLPSLGFEATQTSQFGNQVTLSGAANEVNNVVVTMSSWGCQNGGGGVGYGTPNACVTTAGATFSEPITLNIYGVGANNAVGGLLATDTQTFAIPYRPSASDPSVYSAQGCTVNGGQWYDASDNSCYNGFDTNVTFNLSAQNVVLPSKVIYGIAYNTSDYGATPYGDSTACHASTSGCGYDSLNVGLSNDPSNVSVGSDPNPGTVYWNTQTAGDYCDGGAGGTGTFRIDGAANTATCADGGASTGWAVSGTGSPYYVPAVQFNATPGPASTVVVTSPNLVSGSPTAGQFVVTNETPGGGGSVSIVSGPAGGPSAGSLQMSLNGTTDHWDAFNYDHQGVALSSISTLSYSAYTNQAPNYDPVFQLQANLSPAITFSTVNFEPYEQTPADTNNTWQNFNVLSGVVWGTHITASAPGGINDPISWSAFLSLYPGATISGGVGVDVGSAWPAMIGNVDAISIGTDGAGGATTTYDFAAATAPLVTTQPVSQTYTTGGSVTFTSAASGSPTPTVQWQYSLNSGSTWANLSGATSTTLAESGLNGLTNGWQVRAVFTNSAGSAASNGATMTLVAAPVVTKQPVNQTYPAGGSVTFTSAASGTPTPTVQWQYSLNGGSSWANLSGATSTTLTESGLNGLTNGWQVRAVFTNSAGSAASHGATMTER